MKHFWFLIVVNCFVRAKFEKVNCSRPVNVLFVLKSSMDISRQTFLNAKQFIKGIADAYQIIPEQTDMAVILFGSNASVVINFGQKKTSYFKKEVDKLEYLKEKPLISKALYLASSGIFDKGIPYAARAVVVMTTGGDSGKDVSDAAARLKSSNSHSIFAIELRESEDAVALLNLVNDYNKTYNLKQLLTDQKQQANFLFLICSSLGDIRLNSKTINTGNLQVYKNSKWLPVCSPSTWNDTLTDAICYRLGFSVSTNITTTTTTSRFLSVLNEPNCSGNVSGMDNNCRKIGPSVTGYCNHSKHVFLTCKVPVRLSGSPTRPHIGLVEVLLHGTWGSVCIDKFNAHAANIVCRNLGYKKELKAFVDVSNRFDSLPDMWLSEMFCNFDNGYLYHNSCQLVKYKSRSYHAQCKDRPASVICDTDSKGRTRKSESLTSIGKKIYIKCKFDVKSSEEDIRYRWHYENGRERREIHPNGSRIKSNLLVNPGYSTLIIRNVQVSDGGAYFCVSKLKTEMFFLYIKVNIDTIKREQLLHLGENGRLFCNITGSPPPQIQWKRNNSDICSLKNSKYKYFVQEDGSLLIKNVSSQDTGNYSCKINQVTGESSEIKESVTIELSVYEKPQITIYGQSINQTVVEGKDVHIECNATGYPIPIIKWYKNNTELSDEQFELDIRSTTSDRYTVGTLKINKAVSYRDDGMYTCTAENDVGHGSAFSWLTVLQDSNKNPLNDSKWQLVLGLCFGAFAVAAFGLVIWFVHKKKRKKGPLRIKGELVVSSKYCDIWELPKGSLHLQNMIGTGMFGEVWKAVAQDKDKEKDNSDKKQTVAVKKPKDGSSNVQNEMLKSEIEVNKRLTGKKHANIVNFLGCITSGEVIMMVIEYVPYGDLLGYLRESRGLKDKYYYHCEELPCQEKVSPYELFSFSKQIACGMCFLAEKKVIHRDLAARNVLVGENLTCKITDFGLAKIMKDEYVYMGSNKGRLPIKWTAPEVFVGEANITTQSDVWSYGITLYEIFTIGGDPYPGLGEWDIVYKIKTGNYVMAKPEHVSDKIYEIMVSCWKKDPKSRPTFDELHKTMIEMVEHNHYLDLDMTKYQGNLYVNLDDMDGDIPI